jgi:hypothetical protein
MNVKDLLAILFGKLTIFDLALAVLHTQGKDAARRFITPPRAFVEKACAKSGADVEMAIKERDEAVAAELEFLESLIDPAFTEPLQTPAAT